MVPRKQIIKENALLPKGLLYDTSIMAESKILYGILRILVIDNEECYANIEYLCEKMERDESSVNEMLSELEKTGWIGKEVVPNPFSPYLKMRKIFTQKKEP